MPSHYQRLGLAPQATPQQIRRAYKQRLRQLHPDLNPELPQGDLHELRSAYRTLIDPQKRAAYDRHRQLPSKTALATAVGTSIGKLIARVRPRHTLHIAFEEAISGCLRRVAGQSITIPPGPPRTLHLQSAKGPITCRLRYQDHPFFLRQGPHLHLDVPISCAQALQGCLVEVPSLEGILKVRIPPALRHNPTCLHRRGLYDTRGQRGDLFLHWRLEIPQITDPALIDRFRQLEALCPPDAFPRRQAFHDQIHALYES